MKIFSFFFFKLNFRRVKIPVIDYANYFFLHFPNLFDGQEVRQV